MKEIEGEGEKEKQQCQNGLKNCIVPSINLTTHYTSLTKCVIFTIKWRGQLERMLVHVMCWTFNKRKNNLCLRICFFLCVIHNFKWGGGRKICARAHHTTTAWIQGSGSSRVFMLFCAVWKMGLKRHIVDQNGGGGGSCCVPSGSATEQARDPPPHTHTKRSWPIRLWWYEKTFFKSSSTSRMITVGGLAHGLERHFNAIGSRFPYYVYEHHMFSTDTNWIIKKTYNYVRASS